MSKKNVRAALLAALHRDVAELVRQDNADALLEALNLTKYDFLGADFTCPQIARAIRQLAPLLDTEDLAPVVHAAAHHRHLGKRVLAAAATPHERVLFDLAQHRAAQTLDAAGPGVLARYLLRVHEEGAESCDDASTSAEVH